MGEWWMSETIMQSYGLINLIKAGLNSKFAVEVQTLHRKILVERVEKEGI